MSTRQLCVVLHDVADATLAGCERVIGAVREVAPVPMTFLAVPRFHHAVASPTLEQWLDARHGAGDELSLHGCTHVDDGAPRGPLDRLRRSVYTRGEGEFWALDAAAARERLQVGIDWFARHGWPLHGFVAPAWLLGPGAWDALRASPFAYTSTLRHLHLLPDAGRLTSQSIVYSTSTAWRRASSVAWARVVATMEASNPVLRLELHPRDADHAAVRRSWQTLLEQALKTRTPLTVAEICARARADRGTAATARAGAVRAG